jgi:voltage-gated sodium channel
MASRVGAIAAQRGRKKRGKSRSGRFDDGENNNKNVSNKNALKLKEAKERSVYDWQVPIVYYSIKIRDSIYFQHCITSFIFLAAIMVAVQTYPTPSKTAGIIYNVIDVLILWVFVFEIVIKLLARGKTPWIFFDNKWNKFDFLIVLISFVPLPTAGNSGGIITAFRLLRLLRVLKLVKALPKLRILVIGLFMSLNSIGYIGFLLVLNFYLFACAGVGFFGKNDPVFMGDIFTAMLTLFRCSTLEDWTDVMYTAMYGCENYGYDGIEHLCTMSYGQPLLGSIFFVTFIIVSSMMIMNLFIGIIASSVEDAKHKLDDEALMAEHNAHHKHHDGNSLTEMVSLINKMAVEIENFGNEEKCSNNNGLRMRRVDSMASKYVTSTSTDLNKDVEMIMNRSAIKKHKYIAPPKIESTPVRETKIRQQQSNDSGEKNDNVKNNNKGQAFPYILNRAANNDNNNQDNNINNVSDEMLDLEASIKNGFVSPNVSPKVDRGKLEDKSLTLNTVDKEAVLETSIEDIEKEIANSPLHKLNAAADTIKSVTPIKVTKPLVKKQDMKAHLLTKVFDKQQLKRINDVIDKDEKLNDAIQSLLNENDSDEELD